MEGDSWRYLLRVFGACREAYLLGDLQFARSAIEVLVEVVAALKDRGMFPNPNFSIFIDGGVRRASDVLKAIALGATAGTSLASEFHFTHCLGFFSPWNSRYWPAIPLCILDLRPTRYEPLPHARSFHSWLGQV